MSERRDQAASALLLIPAGVLIVLLLGALIVDTAVVFLAEREAEAAASAAANDLAALAVDQAELRSTGRYVLDPDALADLEDIVRRTALDRLSASFEPSSATVTVSVVGASALEVRVSGQARRIIGVLGSGSRRVSASAVGTAVVTPG